MRDKQKVKVFALIQCSDFTAKKLFDFQFSKNIQSKSNKSRLKVMRLGEHKNYEIQCLRAVAILAVLGFHISPDLIPQGYLGVDM